MGASNDADSPLGFGVILKSDFICPHACAVGNVFRFDLKFFVVDPVEENQTLDGSLLVFDKVQKLGLIDQISRGMLTGKVAVLFFT